MGQQQHQIHLKKLHRHEIRSEHFIHNTWKTNDVRRQISTVSSPLGGWEVWSQSYLNVFHPENKHKQMFNRQGVFLLLTNCNDQNSKYEPTVAAKINETAIQEKILTMQMLPRGGLELLCFKQIKADFGGVNF